MTSLPTPDDTPLLWMRLMRKVLPGIMALLIIAAIASSIRLVLMIDQPFAGVVLFWRKEAKLHVVGGETPRHWPGLQAGLQFNDHILCIDGYHPGSDSSYTGLDSRYSSIRCESGTLPFSEIASSLQARSVEVVDMVVGRQGEVLSVRDIPIVSFSFNYLLEVYLVPLLIGLGFLTLAAVAYRANPTLEINLVFSMLALIIACIAINHTFTGRIGNIVSPAAVTVLLLVPWSAFLGAVLFHFISLIADQGILINHTVAIHRGYYLISAMFAAIGIASYLFVNTRIDHIFFRPMLLFVWISNLAAAAWGLHALWQTWRHSPNRRSKQQARLILIGIGIGTFALLPYAMIIFTNVPGLEVLLQIPGVELIISVVFVNPYLGLAVAAIFAYTILRYQLFASKAVILKLLIIGIISILSASVVYLFLGQIAGMVPILASAFVVSYTLESRRGLTSFLERLLRRESIDYRTVVTFSRQALGLQELIRLLEFSAQSIRKDMDVDEVNIWLIEEDSHRLSQFNNGGIQDLGERQPEQLSALKQKQSPVYASSSKDEIFQALVGNEAATVEVWVPLVERNQTVGLIGLGPRWTGEVYDKQDLQLLTVLAQQLSLALLNTRQVERLRSTAQLIRQAEEHERTKIARELHDTVLQFLTVFTFSLDDLRDEKADIDHLISHWQDRIDLQSEQLRDIVRYLRDPGLLVKQGLVYSLQGWLDEAISGSKMDMVRDLNPEVETRMTLETKVAVFRVIREAVNNTIKHSQADSLYVSLKVQGQKVVFEVVDDGIGFERDDGDRDKGYSSLQDMSVYIEAVDGELTLHSATGEGTTVMGSVCINQGHFAQEIKCGTIRL